MPFVRRSAKDGCVLMQPNRRQIYKRTTRIAGLMAHPVWDERIDSRYTDTCPGNAEKQYRWSCLTHTKRVPDGQHKIHPPQRITSANSKI